MPSTTSSWVSSVLDSSTVMTPSLPTFFIASAMILPMVSSLLAEMVPTWAIMFARDGLGELVEFALLAVAFLVEAAADGGDGLLDAALHGHRIGAGGDGLDAFAVDGLGENGGGGGAVAGDVRGLGSDFADHLGAHVLEAVLQFDFLGDGDAVLGDGRRTEFLFDDNVAALGAERDLHSVGQTG